MVQKFIKIHSNDLVAVALCPLEKGTVCNVDGQEVTLIEDIAQGHKFALKDIKKINLLLNYGYPVGICKGRYQARKLDSYTQYENWLK